MLPLWLVLTQLPAMLSLVPWGILAGRLVNITDKGVSLPRLVILWLVWLYPAIPLGCAIIAWRAYFQGLDNKAWLVTTFPLILALPLDYYLVRYTPFLARMWKLLKKVDVE